MEGVEAAGAGGAGGGWMQVLDSVSARERRGERGGGGVGGWGGKGLQEDMEFKNNFLLFSFAFLFRVGGASEPPLARLCGNTGEE